MKDDDAMAPKWAAPVRGPVGRRLAAAHQLPATLADATNPPEVAPPRPSRPLAVPVHWRTPGGAAELQLSPADWVTDIVLVEEEDLLEAVGWDRSEDLSASDVVLVIDGQEPSRSDLAFLPRHADAAVQDILFFALGKDISDLAIPCDEAPSSIGSDRSIADLLALVDRRLEEVGSSPT